MPKLIVAVNAAVASAVSKWDVEVDEIAVGGRSMGGRAASIAIAEGLEVGGLVLLSYPLHPPGKPDKLPRGTPQRFRPAGTTDSG